MVSFIWRVFLISAFAQLACAQSENILLPGQQVPSLSLPNMQGEVISLNEKRGKVQLLMWFKECGDCVDEVQAWQQTLQVYLSQNVEFMPIVWAQTPLNELVETYKNSDIKTTAVYFYKPEFVAAWWFEPSPALMVVSPDGQIEDLFLHDVEMRKDEISQSLGTWLSEQNWLYEE